MYIVTFLYFTILSLVKTKNISFDDFEEIKNWLPVPPPPANGERDVSKSCYTQLMKRILN